MVELVDTLDLKSNDHCGRAGSSPAPSTKGEMFESSSPFFYYIVRKNPLKLIRGMCVQSLIDFLFKIIFITLSCETLISQYI